MGAKVFPRTKVGMGVSGSTPGPAGTVQELEPAGSREYPQRVRNSGISTAANSSTSPTSCFHKVRLKGQPRLRGLGQLLQQGFGCAGVVAFGIGTGGRQQFAAQSPARLETAQTPTAGQDRVDALGDVAAFRTRK